MALPTRILPTSKYTLKERPPWCVLTSAHVEEAEKDETKKFINENQKNIALPRGMQQDPEKERTTWLHTNPEQKRITKALMRVIRYETEKRDTRHNDKGYAKLWEVVEKTKILHGLHGSKVVQTALKSQGRRGYRFKLKETAPGVFFIKTRHKESRYKKKQKEKRRQVSSSSFAETFQARGKGA